MKLIWTFLFLIGLFGDGTYLFSVVVVVSQSLWLNMCVCDERSETNLRPWEEEFRDIKKGSKRTSWDSKQPRAYWKGNPDVVSPIRMELMKCNHSRLWGAQIMRQVRFLFQSDSLV